MKLRSLSKKLLPLSFAFCFANSSVLPSTATVFKNQQQSTVSDLQKDALNDPDLSERMKKLILKYNKDFDYEKLSDEEKYELFEVQGKFFQNLGYNPYFKFDYEGKSTKGNRAYTEWYGANLWVNLSASETRWWIDTLKTNYYIGKYSAVGLGALGRTTGTLAQAPQNRKTGFILRLISLIASVGEFYAYYFDWEHLSELAKSSNFNSISYRFSFGFIPTGVYSGYRHVPDDLPPKKTSNESSKTNKTIMDESNFFIYLISWIFGI